MFNAGISVYAGLKEYNKDDNTAYLRKAKSLGITHVFSSAHITEAATSTEELKQIIDDSLRLGLKLTLDISKPKMEEIMLPEGLYALRLDYGFSEEEIVDLSNNAPYLIELNCSTIKEERLMRLIDLGLNPSRTTLSFNFYPKRFTGHSIEMVKNKTMLAHKYGFKTSCFIPSHVGFRPPLYEGLPTVESHRTKDLAIAIEELKAICVDGIIFGDSYASLDEIKLLIDHNVDELLIKADISDSYNYLYDKTFIPRSDTPECMIRVSNIKVKEEIQPNNIRNRNIGDITIDNELFKRYAGEINLITMNLPSDDRVNIIGHAYFEDEIISSIFNGAKFKFIK